MAALLGTLYETNISTQTHVHSYTSILTHVLPPYIPCTYTDASRVGIGARLEHATFVYTQLDAREAHCLGVLLCVIKARARERV